MISLIAAMDQNRVIGDDGAIPWRLPADMAFFRKTTMGKPVIMGRKTWESLPAPLAGRQNIIVTRSQDYKACGGAVVTHSVESALAAAGDVEEIMVIGGAQLYAQMLDSAGRIYLSQIETTVDGDARFPEFDLSEWREIDRIAVSPDEKNPFPFEIVTYERSES